MSKTVEDLELIIVNFMRQVKLLEYYQILKSNSDQGKIISIKDDKVIKLDLSGHSIAELPNSISKFTELTSLKLSNCDMVELPEAISELTNLTFLDLSYNNFRSFPNQVLSIASLRQLNLRNMGRISTLDGSALASLSNLRELNLGNNNIQSVEDGLVIPGSLEILKLDDNNLKNLNFVASDILSLKTLDLDNNQLKSVSTTIKELRTLRSLNFSQNRIEELPDAIGQLTHLRILDISENNLKQLPSSLFKLIRLEILSLEFNNISYIPLHIKELKALRELWVGNNNLSEVPRELGELFNLEVLRLNNNSIYDLPKNFLNLHLSELNLLGNNLPEPHNFLYPDRESVFQFYEKICENVAANSSGQPLINDPSIREISKIHVFLSSGQALLTFNGLTETIHEMDAPLAGVFQVAMNIIDTEGRLFIPIRDKDGRSIQITVNEEIGLGFDFLGVHSSLDLQDDYYLRTAIAGFVHRYGKTLRKGIVEISGVEILQSFMFYLKTF